MQASPVGMFGFLAGEPDVEELGGHPASGASEAAPLAAVAPALAPAGGRAARHVSRWAAAGAAAAVTACVGAACGGALPGRPRAAAAVLRQQQQQQQLAEVRGDSGAVLALLHAAAGGSWDLLFSAFVSWRAHPGKCWDYSHRKVEDRAPRSGMPLELFDCLQEPDLFFLPLGTGTIRLGGFERYCLDSPGMTHVQFWNCKGAPSRNLQFALEKDASTGSFYIDGMMGQGKCLFVPTGSSANRKQLQIWPCDHLKGSKELFDVHIPIDCEWELTEDWGGCSEACGGGHQLRKRRKAYGAHMWNATSGSRAFYALKEFDHARLDGKECFGDSVLLRSCNTHKCPASEALWLFNEP